MTAIGIGISPVFGSAAGAGGAAEYYERILDTGDVIALWRLNETAGSIADNAEGTAARDGAYTGVDLNNAQFTNGDPVPLFDGLNDYVNIYSTSLNTAFNGQLFTILVNFKVFDAGVWTDGVSRHIAILRVSASNRVEIFKSGVANTLVFVYVAGGTNKTVSVTASGTGWYQAAITVDLANDRMRPYVNQAQQGADQTGLGTWSGALSSTLSLLGAANSVPGGVFHGWLSHAAIFNKELTAAEIAAL